MCLLSVGLDTLGLLLRVWLWISVPMALIILCVGTWLNYLRTTRAKGNVCLAVEGMGGEVGPGGKEFGEVRDLSSSDEERRGGSLFGAGELGAGGVDESDRE